MNDQIFDAIVNVIQLRDELDEKRLEACLVEYRKGVEELKDAVIPLILDKAAHETRNGNKIRTSLTNADLRTAMAVIDGRIELGYWQEAAATARAKSKMTKAKTVTETDSGG